MDIFECLLLYIMQTITLHLYLCKWFILINIGLYWLLAQSLGSIVIDLPPLMSLCGACVYRQMPSLAPGLPTVHLCCMGYVLPLVGVMIGLKSKHWKFAFRHSRANLWIFDSKREFLYFSTVTGNVCVNIVGLTGFLAFKTGVCYREIVVRPYFTAFPKIMKLK